MPSHRLPTRREAQRAAAARHRQLKQRRTRAAWLGGSVIVTLVVTAASFAWPSSTPATADSVESATLVAAQLPIPAPAPDTTAATTTKEAAKAAVVEPTDFPQSGPNTFRTATPVDVAGSGGKNRKYTVEVEDGLPHDPDLVAKQIGAVLGDERGWRSQGWSFTNVDDDADFRILLASPDTVDKNCYPLRTYGEVSCRSGNRVVLNVKRWTKGVEYYGDDLTGYRTYLINHEVGHALGKGHVYCPNQGADAPVMMQQTKGLQGCVKNPWP